jgi:hypothetical protein
MASARRAATPIHRRARLLLPSAFVQIVRRRGHRVRDRGAGRHERLDRRDEGGAIVGGEPAAQDQTAVGVPVPGQRAAGGGVLGWGVAAADRPHDGLDVAGGAGQRQIQQDLLGGGGVGHRGVAQVGDAGGDLGGDPGQGRCVGAGDPGDRPSLGERELPGGERLADAGQVAQGVGDAEVFGGGARAHPGPPGQPVRTRTDPVTGPTVPVVELG